MKPTPCTISDGACIQLSTNKSWIVRGDKIVHGPNPITHGRKGFETPLGNFPVLRKVKDEWSRPYNAPMPWSTYFTESGIAFHEGELDVPSHGCIHLDPAAAQFYFTNLAIGETVQVVASGPGFRAASVGQALTQGVEGQAVRVRTEGGRVLTGMPVAERRVEVSM